MCVCLGLEAEETRDEGAIVNKIIIIPRHAHKSVPKCVHLHTKLLSWLRRLVYQLQVLLADWYVRRRCWICGGRIWFWQRTRWGMPTNYQLAHEKCWLEAYGEEHPLPDFIPKSRVQIPAGPPCQSKSKSLRRTSLMITGDHSRFFKPRSAHEKRLWKPTAKPEEDNA